MTVQDSPTVAAGIELAGPKTGAAPLPTLPRLRGREGRGTRPIRRLPVQKDWPTWALLVTQVGILIGGIAFWELGARAGWIDAFFWSQPSAIANTLVIFFTAGDAWTDIGFT